MDRIVVGITWLFGFCSMKRKNNVRQSIIHASFEVELREREREKQKEREKRQRQRQTHREKES